MKVEFTNWEGKLIRSAIKLQDSQGYVPFIRTETQKKHLYDALGSLNKVKTNVAINLSADGYRGVCLCVEKYIQHIMTSGKAEVMKYEEKEIFEKLGKLLVLKLESVILESTMNFEYGDKKLWRIKSSFITEEYDKEWKKEQVNSNV